MNLEIAKAEFGDRPQVRLPDPRFYLFLGEEGIRNLVSDHYDLLVASSIRHLFPADNAKLNAAKKRSADFFIQICGGPDYFNQNRGQPMMIRRHQPFKIDAEARIVWLNCYKQLLPGLSLPGDVVQSFWDYLNIFSVWMVNSG